MLAVKHMDSVAIVAILVCVIEFGLLFLQQRVSPEPADTTLPECSAALGTLQRRPPQ